MANVIKHKRGSGSDPVASDLVVGEVAIRTDVGKLFTKMDNGSVAEIAGGGSDIAINTLSSSSATGGGSATFNGSAYRFTLSAPPNVSAAQLLVSINGVIQKPVAGTGQPSEGFSVDGTDIILGDAPATGSDFFILTFKSLGVSEPADNSVTSAKIVDGAIVNADINASAAIDGSKISPTFTSDLTISNTAPSIYFTDTNHDSDFRLLNQNGVFKIFDQTNSADRLEIYSGGQVVIDGNLDVGSGLDVTGDVSITDTIVHAGDTNTKIRFPSNDNISFEVGGVERLRIDNVTGNQVIARDATASIMRIENSTAAASQVAMLDLAPAGSLSGVQIKATSEEDYSTGANRTAFFTIDVRKDGTFSERFRIDSSGNVGINATSLSDRFTIGDGDLKFFNSDEANNHRTTFIEFQNSSNRITSESNFGSDGSSAYAAGYKFSTKNYTGSAFETLTPFVIQANGNVGINNTTPAAALYVNDSSSDNPAIFDTGNGNGAHIRFKQIGSTKHYLGCGGGISMGNANQLSMRSTDNIHFATGNSSTIRASFLNGGGLSFNGDTAAANALDDYEEGTWTPAYNAGSASAACFASGISYNTGGQTGRYTKIGNIVYFRFNIDAASSGLVAKSGVLQVNGLPFTAKNETYVNAGGASYMFTSAFGSGDANKPNALVLDNSQVIQFYKQNGSAFAGTDLSGPQQPIQMFGFYQVA